MGCCCCTKYCIHLIGGELIKLLQERYGQPYPPQKVLKMFYQTCRAVAHMHKQTPPVIHRDLKVLSVLIDVMMLTVLNEYENIKHIFELWMKELKIEERSLESVHNLKCPWGKNFIFHLFAFFATAEYSL